MRYTGAIGLSLGLAVVGCTHDAELRPASAGLRPDVTAPEAEAGAEAGTETGVLDLEPIDGASGVAPVASGSESRFPSEDPIVVPLFGIDGCPEPPKPSGVPTVVARPNNGPQLPLPPELVRRVIRQAKPSFVGCYADSPAHQACRNATLDLALLVDAEGRPAHVEIHDDPDGLGPCTSEAVMGLRFPAPSQGTAVTLRFVLEYRVARSVADVKSSAG